MLNGHTLVGTEKEKELLEKQRGDRRGSKDRKTMTKHQARLQANGTTSVVVLTSRVGNKRASFTTVSDSIRQANPDYYRSVIATMNIQASELMAAPAPAAAVGPSEAGPAAATADPGPSAAEAGPSNPPQPLQRGISRRQLSIAADEDSIINRWKGGYSDTRRTEALLGGATSGDTCQHKDRAACPGGSHPQRGAPRRCVLA